MKLATSYSTGHPIIKPGVLIAVMLVTALGAINDINQIAANSAGTILAIEAVTQYILHRLDRPAPQEDLTA